MSYTVGPLQDVAREALKRRFRLVYPHRTRWRDTYDVSKVLKLRHGGGVGEQVLNITIKGGKKLSKAEIVFCSPILLKVSSGKLFRLML